MVTVSKCLTGEEEIEADFIMQHRSDPVCRLPLKISTVQFWNILTGDWEPQSPVMLESNRLKDRWNFLRAFSLMASRNLLTWNEMLNVYTKLAVSFQSFACIAKSQQTWREVDTAQTELNGGWELIWKCIWLRCACTKETVSLCLNFIIKCVNFSRITRIHFVKYQNSAFKFSLHHLHTCL